MLLSQLHTSRFCQTRQCLSVQVIRETLRSCFTILFTSFSYPPSWSSMLVFVGSGCCRFQYNILVYLQTLSSVIIFPNFTQFLHTFAFLRAYFVSPLALPVASTIPCTSKVPPQPTLEPELGIAGEKVIW